MCYPLPSRGDASGAVCCRPHKSSSGEHLDREPSIAARLAKSKTSL